MRTMFRNLTDRLLPEHRNRHGRRAAVAVLFASMAVPVIGLVGLAIDYGLWNEANATLQLADSTAALNAVKTANAGFLKADPNYIAEGVAAGKQWFAVEIGQGLNAETLSSKTANATVTLTGTTLTATVSYSGTMTSLLGRIFHQLSYPVSVTATAQISTAPYLQVVMMLDNSSSMDIGATTADMQMLMQNSACDPNFEWTSKDGTNYSSPTMDQYGNYAYSVDGYTYDGTIPMPVVDTNSNMTLIEPKVWYLAPYCGPTQVAKGYCSQLQQCPTKVNNQPAYAGPPCAFACHWDNSAKAGLGNDLWATARKLGVTPRLDLVKRATRQVISSMQADNISSLNNLSVGLYAFNLSLTQLYPTNCVKQSFGCEAGSNWTTALAAIGAPPAKNSGVYTDTGLQPVVAGTGANGDNNDGTEAIQAMNTLATQYVTSAGDGSVATKPRKVLFLITDGVQDDPTKAGTSQEREAMPSSMCQQFKDMGYTVYVVYTPYYPVTHTYYLENMMSWAESSGSTGIVANLQACSSATGPNNLSTYYIQASNQSQLTNALQNFLISALQSSVKFTQ